MYNFYFYAVTKSKYEKLPANVYWTNQSSLKRYRSAEYKSFQNGSEALAYFYVSCGQVAPAHAEIEKIERRLELSRRLKRGIKSGDSASDIIQRSRSDTDLTRSNRQITACHCRAPHKLSVPDFRQRKCIKCVRKSTVSLNSGGVNGQSASCSSCSSPSSYTLLAML